MLVALAILGVKNGQAEEISEKSAATENSSLPTVATAVGVSSPPVIDGDILPEPIWQNAPAITGFWQTTPDEGQPASEKTEVRIIYTAKTLYIGVVCYDRNPGSIIVSHSRRDGSLNETDCFQILLDTYNDKRNGFLFGTNPAGIEYDAQITNEGQGFFGSGGGGFNLNWDGSWDVKAKITEFGWCAEFAIPFRTLRFSDAELQTWGLNFQRNIRKRNESAFWVNLPRQFDIQKVSLAGALTGLENIQQKNLKLMPYGLGEASRDFDTQQEADFSNNLGIDLKYSLTPSLTLDATYNTDFAQVEVDELQINLDRFNLFFPEKRPFFLENAGSFSVGSPGEVELFFSRRIGISNDGQEIPIFGGVRLSGKGAGMNVGFINMQTESVAKDTLQANNFTVIRLGKELANRSSIGGIFVNRSGTGDLSPENDYNRTFGIDGRWGIGKYLNLSGFAAQTATPGVSGDEYAFEAGGNYDSEYWIADATYREVAGNFNPEVGFLSRDDYRHFSFVVLHRYRPKNLMGFLELRPHVSYQGFWKFNGFQETGRWHIDNHWEWKNGYEFHTGINFTKEGVREPFEIYPGVDVLPGTYNHREAQLVFNTNRGAWWSFAARSIIGGFFGGKRFSISPSLSIRAGETFNTEFSLFRNDVDLPRGDFVTNLLRARMTYSFTPRIFLSTLFQYNDRDNIGSINVRFGWLQTANTGLFLVFNDSQTDETGSFQPRFRSFIVKYSYLFDLLR